MMYIYCYFNGIITHISQFSPTGGPFLSKNQVNVFFGAVNDFFKTN